MLSGLWRPRTARHRLMLALVLLVLLTLWINTQSGLVALWRPQHAPQQTELYRPTPGAEPGQSVPPVPDSGPGQSGPSVPDPGPGQSVQSVPDSGPGQSVPPVPDSGPGQRTPHKPDANPDQSVRIVPGSGPESEQSARLASDTGSVVPTSRQPPQPALAAVRRSQVIRLPVGQGPASPRPHNGTRTILYWNKFYNNADFYVGYGRRPFRGCAQDNCVTTSNRSKLTEADAILFHMLNKVLPLPPRQPHQRFVFFLKEPPTLANIREPRYRGVFNLTMTYRRDSDVLCDYFSVQQGAEPTPLPAVERRSKAVAWIVSHCKTASGRELYVDQLQRFIDVDVYGKCGPLRCPTPAHGGGDRKDCYRRVAEDYHFYLAFENSQCRDYVTEKLSLPLQHGMVPVVLGDSRQLYERVAPPGSFIHIADFAGPQQLADHLRYLMANRTAYLEYFDWRRQYTVGKQTGWCSLCQYLHETHAPQHYADIGSWWTDGGACSQDTVVPDSRHGRGREHRPPQPDT